MNMADYILSVLKTKPVVVMSWGAQKFRRLEDNKGISFQVNGFMYRGIVKVEYDRGSDTFNVIIGEDTIEDVHVSELIDVLDVYVETGDMDRGDYEDCLNDWLRTVKI